MRVIIKAPASVAYEIRLNALAYGLSLDDFARTGLQLAELFMSAFSAASVPTPEQAAAATTDSAVPDEEEQPVTSKKPNFLWDFCSAVLPTLKLRHEFYRASALCEDTVLRLRASRMGVEAFNREALPRITERRPLINPALVVEEKQQYISADTLVRLKKAGGRVGYFHRAPVGPVAIDLNAPATNEAAQKGMTLTDADIILWLPTLKRYGFLAADAKTDDVHDTSTREAILHAFSHLLGVLLEGVCFILLINPRLEGKHLRSDLMVVRHRAQRIASAWEEAILRLEVKIHQLNAHSELLSERLLILASHAEPMESIFGLSDAVPVVVGAREQGKEQGEEKGAPRETVTDADLAAWRQHGSE